MNPIPIGTNEALSGDVGPSTIASSLNVLTLTPFFPSAQDEVRGCFVAETLEALRERGIQCPVIAVSTLHRSAQIPSPAAPAEWLRYPQLPGNLGLSSAGRLLYARLFERIKRLHRCTPIDLIHAHAALPCGHAAMLLAKKLRIPFVVTVHGLDVFNTCFMGGRSATWRRDVSRDVYRAARIVICISRRVQENLLAGMPDGTSSVVVYNGANPRLFSPAPSADRCSRQEILIVGNLLPAKGHELVLKAIGRIKTSFPELRCTIIGEGPDRARLLNLANEVGIKEQVNFVGQQSRSAVAGAMRACTLLALPSRYEGLGCVYLEAMSCGKPVIACRGQGIDEIIEHRRNGWLISLNDIEELVEGLIALLNNPGMCATIGQAARDTILSELTLAQQANRLEAVYREATT